MGKAGHYVAHQADASGFVRYSEDENRIWSELYARQARAIHGKACDEFEQGLALLDLPKDRVPQLAEVSAALRRETGWCVEPVPALIPFEQFCQLLSQRRFPAATFVRHRDELDYLQEPDIFHELFGHAPMLTHRYFADFTQRYGVIGLQADEQDREMLATLYWFTVEFGLMQKSGEAAPRIYGGGILSSIGETAYALGPRPQRRRFDLVEVLRTPYRINIMQPVYYVIEELRELFELTHRDLPSALTQARRLGSLPPLFAPDAEAMPLKSMPRARSA
ncbi:MAG: phenylalanine 4-monooxygenase [Nevskiaceae bacterium]|nr:MAG: phenylalanine 4-monooxygenase [Nevskiaceae bacterium]